MSIQIDGIVANSDPNIIGYTTSANKEVINPGDILWHDNCLYNVQTVKLFNTGNECIEYTIFEMGINQADVVFFVKNFNLIFKDESYIHLILVDKLT
ncbi:MAG: hypothetical protein ACP6IQ_01985 [Candidatus Njordarchaeia archaeon]